MDIWWWFQSTFAGVWGLIWHWGVGIGVIILLVAAAIFTDSIPVFGKYLSNLRRDLLWCAACVAFVMAGMVIGTHDEKKVCDARTVVIEKRVNTVVKSVKTPKLRKQDDPYDSPSN